MTLPTTAPFVSAVYWSACDPTLLDGDRVRSRTDPKTTIDGLSYVFMPFTFAWWTLGDIEYYSQCGT